MLCPIQVHTCLGSLPLMHKSPCSFLCWSFFAVHTWRQQKPPHTWLLMSIFLRWLDFNLFFRWLLQVCTCIGIDGTKSGVRCGIFWKIYKIWWTHLIWLGSYWDLLVCFNPSCLFYHHYFLILTITPTGWQSTILEIQLHYSPHSCGLPQQTLQI